MVVESRIFKTGEDPIDTIDDFFVSKFRQHSKQLFT